MGGGQRRLILARRSGIDAEPWEKLTCMRIRFGLVGELFVNERATTEASEGVAVVNVTVVY